MVTNTIEVKIISRETIKPSEPTIQDQKPYKLSFFDQLTPSSYASLLLFYSMKESFITFDINELLPYIKKCLSDALNIFYPISGRIRDNMVVDSFDSGVPFVEAQVNCTMASFLEHIDTESLEKFLPCINDDDEDHQETILVHDDHELPLFLIQASKFTCGGVVFSGRMLHKICDAVTIFSFCKVWQAMISGSRQKVMIDPILDKASSIFPPKNPFPQKYLSLMGKWWFQEAKYVTRRFVFGSSALSTLRSMASSGTASKQTDIPVDAPITSVKALSAFLWKSFMSVTRKFGPPNRLSMLGLAVNLRPRLKSLLDGAIGNLFWCAMAVSDQNNNMELHDLVNLVDKAIAQFDDVDYIKTLQGNEGFESICETLDLVEQLLFMDQKPDLLAITSWCKLGLSDIDFGAGKPTWIASGPVKCEGFINQIILVESSKGVEIEAWVTIDEERMAILEQDPNFLAYATPNPSVRMKQECDPVI